MVNVMRQAVGLEEFVTVFNCKGFKKDMPYLLRLLEPFIDKKVFFVVADGANAGLLKLVMFRYPWYVRVR